MSDIQMNAKKKSNTQQEALFSYYLLNTYQLCSFFISCLGILLQFPSKKVVVQRKRARDDPVSDSDEDEELYFWNGHENKLKNNLKSARMRDPLPT